MQIADVSFQVSTKTMQLADFSSYMLILCKKLRPAIFHPQVYASVPIYCFPSLRSRDLRAGSQQVGLRGAQGLAGHGSCVCGAGWGRSSGEQDRSRETVGAQSEHLTGSAFWGGPSRRLGAISTT